MQKIRLSVDDGCASDVRVAELAKKYNIECIFYWPVEHRSLAYDNQYEPLNLEQAMNIVDDGFEIGSHTFTHRHLTKLDMRDVIMEVEDSKLILEKIFNIKITKFCPPRGYTNEYIDELVHSKYKEQRLTKGEHLVHIHPDSGANGNRPWRECITDKTTELWGHSWEFDKYNLWEELEEFLSECSSS